MIRLIKEPYEDLVIRRKETYQLKGYSKDDINQVYYVKNKQVGLEIAPNFNFPFYKFKVFIKNYYI